MSLTFLAVWAAVTAVVDGVAYLVPAGPVKNVLNVVGSLGPGALVSAVQSLRGK